jgi:hypothetical protein
VRTRTQKQVVTYLVGVLGTNHVKQESASVEQILPAHVQLEDTLLYLVRY